MAKFSSSELLDILRKFEIANDSHSPRHIEYVKVLHPSEENILFTFRFFKTVYGVLIDNTAEDDINYVRSEVGKVLSDFEGDVVSNPGEELAAYGIPYKGKDIYLWREVSSTERLDSYLATNYPDKSRSTWQKHIKRGDIMVNGSVVTKPKHGIEPQDSVTIHVVDTELAPTGEIPIIYEDSDVCVINKPTGVLTHAKGAIAEEFTVADLFRKKSTFALDTNRTGIIHRLDRDTSGVLIGAMNDKTAALLKEQFSERKAKKVYYAVVRGVPKEQIAKIDLPIGRNPSSPSSFRVDPSGKSAQTNYEVLAVNDSNESLIRLTPRTGRTHQLRVHMAYIGNPIVGDRVYGKEDKRLFLHAYSLEITTPGGNRRTFVADIPEDFLDKFPDFSGDE